ncbi:hypothetical protein BVX94_02810 [bacterium B17]|nr:hypothetical protein BVX94_02810 [bacterium B17]
MDDLEYQVGHTPEEEIEAALNHVREMQPMMTDPYLDFVEPYSELSEIQQQEAAIYEIREAMNMARYCIPTPPGTPHMFP